MNYSLKFFLSGKRFIKISIALVVFLMLISPLSSLVVYPGLTGQNIHQPPSGVSRGVSGFPLLSEARIPVPVAPNSIAGSGNSTFTGNAHVLVTFKLSNQSYLNQFLSELSNPSNPNYHKYITRHQFEEFFGPSNSTYNTAVNYFRSFNGMKITTFSDHVSLEVSGPAAQIDQAFNTTLISEGSGIYSASNSPLLPSSIASSVSLVTGLSNEHLNLSLNLVQQASNLPASISAVLANGYPSPASPYVYGSNMQVAYNEQSLLNVTYPTKQVIATILWSGTNYTNGQNVGPYNPSDIYYYYNQTLPSYEPHSKVYGVPVNGAPKPGLSASYDNTSANIENTLDLQMIGSTAPGSSIYNVYGPNATFLSLDAAFAYILNPNSTNSALNNVSVISNSWGGPEFNDTAWYTYLQEAQTRGITVLASSGDSGDNPNSSMYLGGSYVQFPSAMSYNNFGITAVGGTTVTLSSSSTLVGQTAWYESANYTSNPVGSTGGISGVFPEPSWQLNSLANNLLNGAGRGVPDIGALANNTYIYITITQASLALSSSATTSGYSIVGGTSVASPIEAGIVAEMDAVLNLYNQTNLGFLNPQLYNLADMQFQGFTQTSTIGFYPFGTYNSTLPITPFYNVYTGRNHVYDAIYPYNLVTGWGSIDAYNFTNLVLDRNFSGQLGKLSGVQNNLTLTGLGVTSYNQVSTGVAGTSVNTLYNASVQQNFMISDQMGAPIYWIQNVIYINGSAATGWAMNYTGWVVFPFYGQYPSQTVYEYNFPLTGKLVSMPHSFNIKSWITGSGINAVMNFQVNSQVLQLPVPGAAYIISGSNYTYTWQGHTYYNGPYPNNIYPGGLTPQFTLTGGPSGGIGEFQSVTGGSMNASVLPMGFSTYLPANTGTFTYNVDQTGESAANLLWTPTSTSSWTLGYQNGSSTQGVLSYEPTGYNVTINSIGLPSGSTWYANLSNGISQKVSSSSAYLNLPSGNYTMTFSGSSGYYASPETVVFTVTNVSVLITVQFVPTVNSTLLTPYRSIDIQNSVVYNGLAEVYPNSFGSGSPSIALDNISNSLFAINVVNYSIVAYNLSTDKLAGVVSFSSSLNFTSLYYDYKTDYVYASGPNGDLWSINATSLKVVNSVNIPAIGGGYLTTLTEGLNPTQLLLVSNTGIVVTLNATSLSPLSETVISTSLAVSNLTHIIPPSVVLLGHSLYIADYAGNQVIDLNLTSNISSNISMPTNYRPLSLMQLGKTDMLYVGGLNYSNVLLNTSTGIVTSGLYTAGLAQSSVSNPYNQYQYISVANYSSGEMNQTIEVVNLNTMKVVADMPGAWLNYNMIYDKTNSMVYTSSLYFGTVIAYQPQQFKYSVKFTVNQAVTSTGDSWYVNLSNGDQSGPITQSSYTFSLLNGSYSYTMVTSNNNFNEQNGSFRVDGSNIQISGNLTQPYYTVKFTETGLPAGTAWSVVFNGKTYSSNSTDYSTVMVYASNGTSTYQVINTTDYYTDMWSSQTIDLNGTGQNVTVSFTEFSTLTGVISPSGATIYLNGIAYHPLANGNYTIKLKAGSYSIVVSDPGYVTQYTNITLSSGETQYLNFTLTASSHSGGFPNLGNNVMIYAGIGAGVGAAVLVGIIIFLRKRP